ncbi:polyketide synthase [Stutzerimonas kirkiae]|uniref:Polyketide synthase n=1 Tax=Stutzerimonas kirkiae TaxID=2211392 RepID=A0A4Q9RCN3_9GAMM|nr:acyl carrier protein [Stutzerimonas kirkiae]TBU98123.1 polyketide synthase [Stutzerimonas kirkiae]TBV02362.1 polyketide synthase [Stutzerimonas kirkiae]TBV14673.1 polyketide synthase [Stutzerimonas kirkiae]
MKLEKNLVAEFILDRVAELTKSPRAPLRADTRLVDAGVDSLRAVLICGHLEDKFAIEVEPSLMFEYQTAGEVADALVRQAVAA